MGYNYLESFYQPLYQHTSFLEQPKEEKSDFEKRMEALIKFENDKILKLLHESEWEVKNLTDSQSHQNFQI